MQIDNQRNTYRIWLNRLVMTIIFTLVIIAIIFIPWFEENEFWLSKYHVIIFVSAIYILLNVLNYLKAPCFVGYSDKGEMILLRYYPLSMFNSRKNSIEIPKQHFLKYELKPFLFKTQQKIILYQHFRDKVVKYPAISLSALDKADRELILTSLDKHIPEKRA
jgi:hypothetical protein